jgi:hypothetical protein
MHHSQPQRALYAYMHTKTRTTHVIHAPSRFVVSLHHASLFRCITLRCFVASRFVVSLHHASLFRCITLRCFVASRFVASLHHASLFRCITLRCFVASRFVVSLHHASLFCNWQLPLTESQKCMSSDCVHSMSFPGHSKHCYSTKRYFSCFAL